jgi:uncharacterized membrane protein
VSARSVYRLHALILTGWFVLAASVWTRLPARIPTHFDGAGNPTTWSRTTFLSWFGLPLVTVGMALFLYGLFRLTLRHPALWNIPQKESFLRLSPEARAPVMARLERWMATVGILVSCIFMEAHYSSYQVALGRASRLPWHSDVVTGGIVALIFLSMFVVLRGVGKQIERTVARVTPPANGGESPG